MSIKPQKNICEFENRKMKSIAVFCASAAGENPIYSESAYGLGKFLANSGIKVIYGGASVGCMGALARGALEAGGDIIGVLPNFLRRKEIAKLDLEELILVDSMHERKLKMNELSDGVITMPGGFGTMEEFFEMLTWAQLGLHQKPIGIFNVNNYYDQLFGFIKHMNKEKLLKNKHMEILQISSSISELLGKMQHYNPPPLEKWLKEKRT